RSYHRGQVRRRRDYERRGGSGRQLKLPAHGATGATGTRATGATGTLATGATGTRATGVTGSMARRAAGATESRATGATGSRATGATLHSHDTPLAPLLRLPHTHPPQRQLQQWETEEEEEGTVHTPATPIPPTQVRNAGSSWGGV
ncbi:unnamed protein product, partial [Closterium sp. NIES-53]